MRLLPRRSPHAYAIRPTSDLPHHHHPTAPGFSTTHPGRRRFRHPIHPMESYAHWTPTELIKRVTELEAQLNAPNGSATPRARFVRPTSAAKKEDGKKERAGRRRAFDPSKYETRLVALKFAYLGRNYNGFEHHANNVTPLPTVEEELWRALRKTKLIFPRFGREGGSADAAAAAGRREEEDGWEAVHGWHPWRGEERREQVCWDGCEYSKCGRTDKGVSAFGQVVGVRVRSSRPKAKEMAVEGDEDGTGVDGTAHAVAAAGVDEVMPDVATEEDAHQPAWDPVRDELPYIQLLNRVLPPDIRVLAWCPDPPPGFSARFSCKERRYRYFFTNPAYMPLPSAAGARAREGWLDVEAMQRAAKKLEGLHDFRNFCKIDPSKQITNFERRIFSAGIFEQKRAGDGEVSPADEIGGDLRSSHLDRHDAAKIHYFEVRGSAFLWHQVRHMVGILFLVGQGYEDPGVVDELLDVRKTPASPAYEMASDAPLVLWDCVFPDPVPMQAEDHADACGERSRAGYEDGLNWIYVGDEHGGRDRSKRFAAGIEDGKHGRNGIMEELWALWRRSRMDEILAGGLLNVVARLGGDSADDDHPPHGQSRADSVATLGMPSARVFDGSEEPVTVGKYIPVMQRKLKGSPEDMNARYAARKGINGSSNVQDGSQDVEE